MYCMVLCALLLQEFFIQDICKDAYNYTKDSKRKTMQKKDLGEVKYQYSSSISTHLRLRVVISYSKISVYLFHNKFSRFLE